MYFSTREEAISYLVNHQRGPIDYSWRSPARSYTYNISPTAITSDISIMAKILKFRDIDTQELDDEIRAIMSEFNNKYAKAFSDTAYAMDYSRADKNFLALYKVGLSKAGYPIIEYNANIDYKEDFSDWCDNDIKPDLPDIDGIKIERNGEEGSLRELTDNAETFIREQPNPDRELKPDENQQPPAPNPEQQPQTGQEQPDKPNIPPMPDKNDKEKYAAWIDDMSNRAWRGEFGGGEQRREVLGDAYDDVQAAVNAKIAEREAKLSQNAQDVPGATTTTPQTSTGYELNG